ncbi:tensin-like [Agrilus planipennis]|uniref:Tensin-like n=2 Tax=Agrilus planipennis TaxID=224129 RepID=A0A7F5R7A2_AGRPL|nr:tensin-like [Agrilus planipennis]
MDSGISSAGALVGAGHQQNANTNASTSPPPTAQPSPLTPEDQHRELDELLSDMMLTVQNIPDIKPRQQQNSDCDSSSATTFNLDNVRYIDEEEDKNIPYHARQDSKPFTYGVNSNMIGDSKKLSSPSLVRKASFNKSSGDTLKKVQTQVYPNATYKSSNYSSPSSNYNSSTYNSSIYNTSDYSDIGSKYNYSTLPPKRDPIDSIFTPSALSASDPYKKEFREEFYKDEVKRYDPLKRSHTDGTIKRSLDNYSDYRSIGSPVSSPLSDGNLSPPSAFRSSPKQEGYSSTINGNLTWLQRQQLKLKERREQQLRDERQPHETRLLSELRQVHSRHLRPSASHRADGYTSDTTAFADDDEDFTVPLHINTTSSKNISSPSSPHSGSALRNFSSSQTSIYSNTTPRHERPFMAVKRAHEVQKYAEMSSSPASILAANPLGNVIRSPSRGVDSTDSGLLSLVEKESYAMKQGPTPTMVGTMPSQNSFNSSNQSTLIINETEHKTNPMQHDALADLIASLSNGSDTSNDSPNSATNWQYREESVSSWRTQSASEVETSPPRSVSPRPQTPAFPVHSRTPYMNSSTPTVQFDLPTERLPPKSPTTQRHMSYPTTSSLKYYRHGTYPTESKDRPTSPNDLVNGGETYNYTQKSPLQNGSASPTIYYGSSRRSSVHSESPHEVSPAHVKFVRDTSKFWYKSTISRDQAINMLRDQPPGTFVVRDSNSFPGAFGLALKVATLPSNVQTKSPNTDEYVRHFLIEPTSRGVRLKGCANEPVFSSLSALIYQHSVTQMALPCRLVLPEGDIKPMEIATNPAQQLFNRGAACNVLYLYSVDMESLTGPQAVRKAVLDLFQKSPQPTATVVHFKVNGQGITLTDSKRKLFFRRHYPTNTISHCGIDPDEHRWTVTDDSRVANSQNRIFGFVARKPARSADNQCHLFAELEPEQPASAIVNFVNRILTSSGARPSML